MIIGITGHAQHGKDTTGRALEKHGFTRYALADGVREAALAINPIIYSEGPTEVTVRLKDLVDSVGWDEAKKDPEVRRILQMIGTEMGRNLLGQDVWINRLARKIEEDTGSEPRFCRENIVITDVRFPNEAAAIHRWNGTLWRVKRPGFDNGIGTDHDSERHVDSLPVSYTIIAKTVEELVDFVDSRMRRC